MLKVFVLDESTCGFISIYSAWVSEILESVSWCLPNLRKFQPLFFQINFLHHFFFFPPGTSVTRKTPWFVQKVTQNGLYFLKNNFPFCSLDWIISVAIFSSLWLYNKLLQNPISLKNWLCFLIFSVDQESERGNLSVSVPRSVTRLQSSCWLGL